MSDTISAQLYLKFAKDIEPEIFENKTPKFHLDLINFINSPSAYKAAAVFRGASKTTLLNKICVISRIFFHAEPFTMIASSNDAKATGFLDAVSDAIENAIDKGYALAKGSVWNKNMIEVVVNKGLKDANGKSIERLCHVVSVSAGQDPRGANIKNKRPTLMIVDDLESNVGQYAVASRANRQKLRKWFYADLLPALHPTKGKLVVIGTIIHDDSILNNIINRKSDEDIANIEWDIVKIPIIKDGVSAWPSRFPIQKIEKIKSTLEAAGLNNEFYQEYMCAAIDPQKAIFKREYFRYFKAVEYEHKKPFTTLVVTDAVNQKELKIAQANSLILENGENVELRECKIYTTMDLASSSGQDETAIVTFAIDSKNRIFIIDICSGHWTPFEKSVELIRIYLTFNIHRIGIEKAGMQNDFFYTIDVIQKLTGVRLPIEALTHHGKAKNTRISNLEPYYRTGQIYHNASIHQTTELEAQLISFDSEVESKIDDIMDAAAYILEFIVNRFFDEANEAIYETEEDDDWV